MGLDRDDGQPVDRAADIKQRIEYVVQSVKHQRLFKAQFGQTSDGGQEKNYYHSLRDVVYDIFAALREYEPRAAYLDIKIFHAEGRVSSCHIKYKDKKDNVVRILKTAELPNVRIEE